jgi:beta-mannosidase
MNKIEDFIWWTWDLGKQNLLNIAVSVTNVNSPLEGTIVRRIRTGIRTVKVNQIFDKTYNGTSFTFNLNGLDIYMRGGNYIPPEMSLARTTKQTYQRIVDDALFAKFNMLRLWGGGQF